MTFSFVFINEQMFYLHVSDGKELINLHLTSE